MARGGCTPLSWDSPAGAKQSSQRETGEGRLGHGPGSTGGVQTCRSEPAAPFTVEAPVVTVAVAPVLRLVAEAVHKGDGTLVETKHRPRRPQQPRF